MTFPSGLLYAVFFFVAAGFTLCLCYSFAATKSFLSLMLPEGEAFSLNEGVRASLLCVHYHISPFYPINYFYPFYPFYQFDFLAVFNHKKIDIEFPSQYI